jgi:dTDP-4-amino-4,6-dideoxygalactose transaminase
MFTLLRLLKEYRGKKRIFLQSNTMYGVKTIANTSGLELCGYVECSLDYLMPTYEQVASFISSLANAHECVFLLTHIGGWVNPDIEKIADLCKNNSVALIEDCAHSLGSTLNGNHTGLYGDAGVYSLYATKAIPAGEGGIVVTKDKELGRLIDKFIIYDRFEQELDVGVNFRMSELNALLAFSVLQETESIINNKYQIAKKYCKACDKHDWKYIDPKINGQRSNLYKFILVAENQNSINKFEKITVRTSPVYDYALSTDVNNIAKKHICLPIWYGLEDAVVDSVVEELSL